jgi:hypothetical protein
MEETLAGVVAEMERVVKPLGVEIEAVGRRKNSGVLVGVEKDNDPELSITIVRKGKLG